MKKISFLSLIKTSFMIGLTGYGGPALVGIMKNKFVEEKKWISEKYFLEALSLSQILPGAISVTLIGNFGYKLKGFAGVVLLPFFFLLPAVALILSLSWAYFSYADLNFIKTGFMGLGALVVALLINAVVTLGKSIFGKLSLGNIKSYIITGLIFSAGYFFGINVIALIFISALLGFILYYFGNELKDEEKIVIESSNNIIPVYKNPFYYFCLFSAFSLILAYYFYPVLWNLFYNFFKIGMFGFGGGYTVIPLIQKQVVEDLGLVTFTEFRDGIAMGQITPGPVFITTTFIGFKVAGLAGAIVSTIASYSPSLIAVVTLNKVLLRIKHKKIVQSIIKGILAGFIGLLLMVVINFGISSLINWQTWLIFFVSLLIIPVFKKDPIWAILATIVLTAVLL